MATTPLTTAPATTPATASHAGLPLAAAAASTIRGPLPRHPLRQARRDRQHRGRGVLGTDLPEDPGGVAGVRQCLPPVAALFPDHAEQVRGLRGAVQIADGVH